MTPREKLMPKRILIVDDDADFRTSVTEVLRAEGHEVLIATSGKQGVEQARAERPDLIVLDIMMEHDWAGYEVNQAVKYASGDAAAAIPILMVSSIQVDPATLFYRATEVGMVTPDSYLTKPLDIQEFLDRVRSLLGT
jgi:DNA-binding response OmpR family regulator